MRPFELDAVGWIAVPDFCVACLFEVFCCFGGCSVLISSRSIAARFRSEGLEIRVRRPAAGGWSSESDGILIEESVLDNFHLRT